MKKVLTSLYTLVVFLAVIINSQFVYADVIMPGQSPSGHGYRRPHEPIKDDQILPYVISAFIVAVIVVVSVVVLLKIRKKK